MSTDKGIDKEEVVHIYTMEYYPAIKKDEIMQMNLQNRKRLTDLENELVVARGKG